MRVAECYGALTAPGVAEVIRYWENVFSVVQKSTWGYGPHSLYDEDDDTFFINSTLELK